MNKLLSTFMFQPLAFSLQPFPRLCLIHQTNYLLDQLLRQLEQAFLREGGFTERLYKARQQARALPPRPSFKRNRTNQTGQAASQPNPSYPSNAVPPKQSAPKPPQP